MNRTIIADIGINSMGNMSLAKKMIIDLAEIGVDICKFQWYSTYDLFGDPAKGTYNKEIYDLVKPFELSEAKIIELMECCDKYGVEFGCSVFDNDRFDILEKLGVKTHKIASRVSKYDRPLAERMLATGKKTFVSLGFNAISFDKNKYPNMKTLYCLAKYPSEDSDFNLPKSFSDSIYDGFSSHAMNPYPAMVALARGAEIIEVHYTQSKSMVVLPGGYDHLSSLNKDELKQVCDFSKSIKYIS